MSIHSSDIQSGEDQQKSSKIRLLLLGGLVAAVVLVGLLSIGSGGQTSAAGGRSLLILAPLVFLVGIFSFMSPCTLPILPAYFAFTFQARKQSIVAMTVAFFLGLATTMTLLGTAATALGELFNEQREALTFWGGIIVIGFGIMSLLGKGFAGPQVQERPAAGALGSYLYGATFALGWTACIGPILGALLTFLWAAEGVAIVQGALLSFIYAMGLGLPLILVATFFSRLGNGSPFWKFIRGKSFEISIGKRSLHLHTTSLISGVLLILMGWLLASGQLHAITNASSNSPLGEWFLNIETAIDNLFR